MTFYTVVPLEQMFEGAYSNGQQLQEVTIGGMLMQVEPLEGRQARIVRLLQCPLDKYLDPSFAPGAVVDYDK
ncbi:YlzJ-like family protein [Paenibacillus typhae]|uniref:YlzJ-like protein n=1 Tax=Paenibacillus typhae TaxID=1174501 RepID=A0A1G8LAW4_9BACL|nr:YlzJ-like family protein [Paenibacillus typhae]SDI52848.1 YlzJ-like protein [Paenibacillus typhae]